MESGYLNDECAWWESSDIRNSFHPYFFNPKIKHFHFQINVLDKCWCLKLPTSVSRWAGQLVMPLLFDNLDRQCVTFKGILWDVYIFTLEQIIVLGLLIILYLFPKYHISKHYRTRVKWNTKNNKKVKNKQLKVNSLYFKCRLWSN